MKKLILVTTLLVSQLSFSQKTFSEGNNYVSLSYGLGAIGANWTNVYSSLSNYKASTIGPLGAYFEHGVTDNIGLGISVNYLRNSASYDMSSTPVDMTISQLAIAIRAAYHFKVSNRKFIYIYW